MHLGMWEILIIVLVVVLLFGRGKISDLMGDVAKGIKNFKKGMSDETPTAPAPPSQPAPVIEGTPSTPSTPAAATAAGAPAPDKKPG
jgi:sec-independent protein translocase protein TatA